MKLIGSFRSWKYFDEISRDLARQFRFKRNISVAAESFLATVSIKLDVYRYSKEPSVTIGIYVNRGKNGLQTIDTDFIEVSMSYFVDRFGAHRTMFIICSDDMRYARKTMTSLPIARSTSLVFADSKSFRVELGGEVEVVGIEEEAVQLCVMSLCEHSIITTGSLSWWAGWLSRGTVLYSLNQPDTNSQLDEIFSPEDYFPPHWIGFDRGQT